MIFAREDYTMVGKHHFYSLEKAGDDVYICVDGFRAEKIPDNMREKIFLDERLFREAIRLIKDNK